MKKIYTLPFLALLFLPFCANRKAEKHIAISSREVSLAVELDVLKFACERRLYALEAEMYPGNDKKVLHFGFSNRDAIINATISPRLFEKTQPVSASEAIHY